MSERRRILVLAPMRMELKPIVQLISARRSTIGGLSVHVGRAGDHEIVTTTIGVGPAAAGAATERLLGAMEVDHVLVSGIAGGIGPGIEIGAVIEPEAVLDLASGSEYRSSGLGEAPVSGTIATTAVLILDDERLAPLIARGVVAMDMETSAVAAVCEARGRPWSAFRSISDRPQDGLLDASVIDMLNEDGSANAAAAVRNVLLHPWRIPRLAHLARDSNMAAKRAARAAVAASARL
jgi:adenosylhomocysteine nucleosidase